MNLMNVSDASKSYLGNLIFSDIKFVINEKDRIGIVGRNGEGKTTLLKMLAGLEKADSGNVSWKKGLEIAILGQLPDYDPSKRVLDILNDCFNNLNNIEIKLRSLEVQMTEASELDLHKLMQRYGQLQTDYEDLGGYEKESRIQQVANGLVIDHLLNSIWDNLSGGERTKVGLARLLLQPADLLLLDEPTNHLDIPAIDWLSQFVRSYPGAVVIVSHDRYFLDDTVTKVFEIDQQALHIYHGNYSDFKVERERRIESEFHKYTDQQKKISKMKQQIKQLRIWANQAVPPNQGLHRRAKSMEKALERIQLLDKPVVEAKRMNLSIESQKEKTSKDLVRLEAVGKVYDDVLFEDVNLHIRRTENISIVGANGVGKSTLLKIIMGYVQADEGIVKVSDKIAIGYLSQHTFDYMDSGTVLDVFREPLSVTIEQARHILAQFLFYGEDVFKPIRSLSGGEKMRLRWAQLMNQPCDLLILDEPTNHLDIESKEVLEDALMNYQGTVIAVSHDRYFLDKCFNLTYWLNQEGLTRYEGNYSYAVEKMK